MWEGERVDRLRPERHPAFGIAGDWKATALKAEVRVETVTEGGRSVEMAPNQVMGEIVLDGAGTLSLQVYLVCTHYLYY